MRIILYTGKGGVGKTSLSAATGVELASRGHRTLVMSVDPAHSLSDSFDRGARLMEGAGDAPVPVAPNLWIREVDVHQEIRRHWGAIEAYIASMLHRSGFRRVVADELALFPGMEDVTALLCLKQHCDSGAFDVVVLDCAPTAESLRFIAIPATLNWYMKKVFGLERRFTKVARPVSGAKADLLPEDAYFDNLRQIHADLQGLNALLMSPQVTSVRLVTNPETIVVRETQRAFTYFCLSGLTVDAVVVNRVLPEAVHGEFFAGWRRIQARWTRNIDAFFAPVPVFRVGLLPDELCGFEALAAVGRTLYGGRDPAACFCATAPYRFRKRGDAYEVHVAAPFAEAADTEVSKHEDELVVRIGNVRRHILLPAGPARCSRVSARLAEGRLTIRLAGPPDGAA